MSQELDIDGTFRKIMADEAFGWVSEAGLPAFKELIAPLPQEVLDRLDASVTVAVLAELRLAFSRRMIAKGFAHKLFETLSPEARRIVPSPEALEKAIRAQQKAYAEMLMLGKIWLARRGLKERDALAHPTIGRFDDVTMAAYDDGELTVRRLLELQPAVLIHGNV